MESRQEPMKPMVEGLQEQPEELGNEYSTRSTDEEKTCGFEVGAELGANAVGRVDQSQYGRCWRASTTQTACTALYLTALHCTAL